MVGFTVHPEEPISMSNTGYSYKGYWIEQYEHQFDITKKLVWRVLTQKQGIRRIVAKHLPTEKKAELWVDDQRATSKADPEHDSPAQD